MRSYRIAGMTNDHKRSFVIPTFLALVSVAFWTKDGSISRRIADSREGNQTYPAFFSHPLARRHSKAGSNIAAPTPIAKVRGAIPQSIAVPAR